MTHLDPLARLRLQCGVEHPRALGPRATAELLAEVGARIGGMPCIIGLLGGYQQRFSPQMVRAVSAHRFPPRLLRVVP
jgi:hypothetical protein